MSELPSSQAGSVSEADLYEDWSAHPIKVGEFIINFNERYAEAPDGEKRNITPNSIKLLLLLLHNSSSYVSLSDIHKFVYGNQYKDDSSTRKQVTSLRKLFDDTAKEKHYIENKLGHGYRLIAPVEFIDEELGEEENVQEGKKPSINLVFWTLSVLLVPIILVFAYFSLNTTQDGSKPLDYLFGKPTPITHLKGLELYPSLSPDEKWLLFTHRPENKEQWKLYVKDMETGELINLTHSSDSERMPRWVSNTQIVFSRSGGGECDFYMSSFNKVSKILEEEQRLVECNKHSSFAQGELWPDKQGMFFNRAKSVNEPFIIYSHSFTNSESWPIASPPPSGKGDYFFSLSGDGTKLAVLRNKNWSQTEVWVYNTSTWETQLVDTVDNILYMVSWSKNSSSVVYKNDSNQLIMYDISKRDGVVLAQPQIPVSFPIHSSKRGTIFAAGSFYKSDLYKQHLVDKSVMPIESSSYRDLKPAVSKDGFQIAWVSNRTGVFQVWHKRQGDAPRQRTHLLNNLKFVDLSFSPDGTMLGGTASGRWFVINLEEQSVKWGEGNDYFKNFQWRRNGAEAFLAKKHMEQWEQVILSVDNWQVREAGIPEDAFIVLEDHDDDITYIASFKKNGLWRVTGSDYSSKIFIPLPEVINLTGRWSIVSKGLLLTIKGQLYFLDKDKLGVEKVEVTLKGSHISSPAHGEWLLTSEVVEGDSDLMQLR